MNTLDKARAAGLVVLLDACIGQRMYYTVTGTVDALERFEALCREAAASDGGAGAEGSVSKNVAATRAPTSERRRSVSGE